MIDDRLPLTASRVLALAKSTEAASISIIRAVDGTVDALTKIDAMQRDLAKCIHKTFEHKTGKNVVAGCYIDPDDTAIEIFEQVESGLKNFLHALVSKRTAIDRDRNLKDHHCDALHEAYDLAITSTAELVDVVRATRHAIIEHDFAAEPRESETFESVSLLSESLRDE